MIHYLDIRLRPDPEFPPHQLLSALYAKLHRTLARQDSHDVGISFPEYREDPPSLGAHVRLHGAESVLTTLMATSWLTGMHDHVQLSPISPVPAATKHRRVMRVQAKSSPDRLRRRAMHRHGIDAGMAMKRIPDTAAETLHLPFVQLGSRSTGQPSFPMFIRHGQLQDQPSLGRFNSYALSQDATIPWF